MRYKAILLPLWILTMSIFSCSDGGSQDGKSGDVVKSDVVKSNDMIESGDDLFIEDAEINLGDNGVEQDNWYNDADYLETGILDSGVIDGVVDVLSDSCIPDCNMKCGGASDGCGGFCNNQCPSGYVCSELKRCEKVSEPRCGDGKCDLGEVHCSCPSDCKPVCGDGCCTVGIENRQTCPGDCLVDCLKLSYSTYNLLYLGYSEAEVRHFIINSANAGSEFIRIMAIMDLECCRGLKDWVFGPWLRREPKEEECYWIDQEGNRHPKCYEWPYWNLNEWNEEYFRRLNFILDTANQYNVKVLFSIYAIQENPLQFIGADNILNKLSQFIDELKNRGFAGRISHWEIDNEGGTGLFTHENDDPNGSIYFEYTRRLGEKIRNTLGGTLYHSGEGPGMLASVYDVYMPHGWCGPNPIEGNNGFNDEEGITYVEHIRRDYGKSILPSSDGGMPNLCNDNEIREILRKTFELNWVGFEVDIGWFSAPDGNCYDWGDPTPNTGKISDIEWNLAHRVSQIAEEMFPNCKYIRGGIVPFTNDRLNPNERLLPGYGRVSENGKYGLYFQHDCNLVLYDLSQGEGKWQPIWNTNTGSKCEPKWTIMQGDGNLVIVDVNDKPIWASNTENHEGAYLIVRNDGKIAIVYNGNAIWQKP